VYRRYILRVSNEQPLKNFDLRNVTSEVRLLPVEVTMYVISANALQGDKEFAKVISAEVSSKMQARQLGRQCKDNINMHITGIALSVVKTVNCW
jgi:hypothetical protein